MKTQDFITKAWNGQNKATSCGSVFIENGTIYSYGYHYPLLFKVAGKTIRNVRGYSNSTSKHIGWSREISAIDIHTFNTFRLRGSDSEILANLIASQTEYAKGIADEMDTKKRKDTQLFASLQRQYDTAIANLDRLTA